MSKSKRTKKLELELDDLFRSYTDEDFLNFFRKFDELLKEDRQANSQSAFNETFYFFHPSFRGK